MRGTMSAGEPTGHPVTAKSQVGVRVPRAPAGPEPLRGPTGTAARVGGRLRGHRHVGLLRARAAVHRARRPDAVARGGVRADHRAGGHPAGAEVRRRVGALPRRRRRGVRRDRRLQSDRRLRGRHPDLHLVLPDRRDLGGVGPAVSGGAVSRAGSLAGVRRQPRDHPARNAELRRRPRVGDPDRGAGASPHSASTSSCSRSSR